VASKINARDSASMADAQMRADGRKKPKKAQPYEIGSNRRPGRPSPTAIAAAAGEATDATYRKPSVQGQDLMALEAQRARHETRKGWFMTEAHRQGPNRQRMAKCEAMYDNEQWDYQDAQVIKDRGQDATVYNEIKPTIDWLIGTERRVRVDFVVMPEDTIEDADGEEADDDARTKTKLLKWLDDSNKAAFERSWAAEDAFKAGIGWLEVGFRGDRTGAPVFVGAESWRNILWDSQAQKRDLSDARYLFRIKVVDLDVALAIFPNKREEIERCAQIGDTMQIASEWLGGLGGLIQGLDAFGSTDETMDMLTSKPIDMFNTRKRIMLIECWSREPVQRAPEAVGLGDPLEFKIHVSIMTEHDTLIEGLSPYNHDQFPFVPVWGYKARRTGLPYSPIWPLIGPQVGLNKRMARSIFEAMANQVEMEVGAIDEAVMDPEELRAEYDDPQGMPMYAAGALSGNKVRTVQQQGKAAEQIALAEQDRIAIRAMSGVNADNRGMNSNVTSGKAVLAKQDQGSLLTAELFDNLQFSRQQEGDLTLSVAEQGVRAPRAFREPGGPPGEITRINVPQADGSYLNDITKRRARFTVGEQAWKQSYAEASFESLLQVLSQLAPAAPQAVINLLDLVFEMHPTLPRKRAIVQRLRSINGQSDPDGKMTPEQVAEAKKKAAIAKAQFEAQMAKLVADIQEAQARGAKLRSEAVLARLSAIYESAQAAATVAGMPELAPIADQMLRSSGFEDMTPDDGLIDTPTALPRPAAPAPGIDQTAPADGAMQPAPAMA
jgi:hypothetical protein